MNLRIALVLVALVVAFQTTAVKAEEPGQISASALNNLGLGGMQTVSDAQGEQVRGKFLYSPAYIAYVKGIYCKLYGSTIGNQVANQLIAINNYYYKALPNGYNGFGTTPFGGPYIIKYKGL